MAKIVVALIVLTLSALGFTDTLCKRCGYVKKHTHYPPYSKQLQEVIKIASEKTKIKLDKKDIEIINKIIWKENRGGDLKAQTGSCFGLGQGKPASYRNNGLPWKTYCPVEQVMMILLYVRYRSDYGYVKGKSYGTFQKAWQHHVIHNWY
jgi:hypothetical protein